MHTGQMQKEIIAAGVLQGKTDLQIAKEAQIDRSTVNRHRNKSVEVNALIEAGFKELSGSWSKAVKNVKVLVDDYDNPMPKEYSKKDLQKKEHGFKATMSLVESMGLVPSHSQPVYIQHIMVQQNNQFVSPVISRAIDQAINSIIIEQPKYEVAEDDDTGY
jgi:hypothetical protein